MHTTISLVPSTLWGRAQLIQTSRTLSHGQASNRVLQGPLCLEPPPNTWETSEPLLPLGAAKLSHLVLLALESGQPVEPRHTSNTSQAYKQPILCESLTFIFNKRLGDFFSNNTLKFIRQNSNIKQNIILKWCVCI